MRWLSLEMENHANRIGAFRIGPPKVWRTHGRMPRKNVYPLMGVMVKYDRTPQDGMRFDDNEARIGVLKPNVVKDEEAMIDRLVEEQKEGKITL